MRILAPWTAALVPLLIAPGLLYYFDITPKIVTLLIGVSLALVIDREISHNLFTFMRAPLGRWFTILIGLQALLLTVSTFLSTQPALSLYGSTWRRCGLIAELAVLVFTILTAAWLSQDLAHVRTMLRAACASGGLAAIYGIAQYFGFDPLIAPKTYQAGEGPFTIVRPPGTLGHADYFADWLVVVVFSGLALALIERQEWRKRAAWLVSGLASVAILLSGTRAALLGLAAGLIAWLCIRRPRLHVRALAIVAGLCACVGALWISPAGAKLRARAHWSLDDLRGGARLLLWRDTLRMSASRPVVGFGPEAFEMEFPRFESLELAKAYPDFYHESPHNMWLDALIGEGWAGPIIVAALCLLSLYAARRALGTGCEVAGPLAAGLIAVLVCQQFAVLVAPTSLYLYLLAGLLASLAVSHLALSDQDVRHEPSPLFRRVLAVACLGGTCVFVLFATRLLVYDRLLAMAQHRLSSGDVAGAAQAYGTAQTWRPAGSSAALAYSRQMSLAAGQSPVFATRAAARRQALVSAVSATGTAEDRSNAWYNLAFLLASQNDAQGVEKSLRNAIAWAPNWFKPHWALAQLLEVSGHRAGALSEAGKAMQMNGGKDPEVVETWNKLSGKEMQAH